VERFFNNRFANKKVLLDKMGNEMLKQFQQDIWDEEMLKQVLHDREGNRDAETSDAVLTQFSMYILLKGQNQSNS
jgi:phage pi2 protein 07